MKSTLKYLPLVLLILVAFQSAVTSVKLGQRKPRDLQLSWNELFLDNTRKQMKCKKIPDVEKSKIQKAEEKDEAEMALGGEYNMPKKKPNYYTLSQIGWGPSAYLFDFLDGAMENKILQEMKQIWDDATKIIPDPNYKDVYSLENMLNSKGTEPELLAKVFALYGCKENEVCSKFNQKVWKNSITMGQINKILTDWKWFANRSVPDPAKYIVDKYDFNGDGRLSPKEFIIAAIRVNKMVAPMGTCKNCLETIIKENIDPMFMYMDCQNEERINAETMYTNIQHLQTNKWKFYTCDFNGNGYRTSSCNDFIMKAKVDVDGYINKAEWRLAVLLGYWSRHVTDEAIVMDDSRNMKTLRWDKEGQVDLVCAKLKQEQ